MSALGKWLFEPSVGAKKKILLHKQSCVTWSYFCFPCASKQPTNNNNNEGVPLLSSLEQGLFAGEPNGECTGYGCVPASTTRPKTKRATCTGKVNPLGTPSPSIVIFCPFLFHNKARNPRGRIESLRRKRRRTMTGLLHPLLLP